MFDEIRDALDALSRRLDPDEQARMTRGMRDALVHAKMGLRDLATAVAETETRLAAERRELETILRRQSMASNIGDSETVAVAERFASQHSERIAMLETKLMSQQQELAVNEREYESMRVELRQIMSGLNPDGRASAEAAAAREIDEFLNGGGDFSGAGSGYGSRAGSDAHSAPRASTRVEKEAVAEARLAELKRRMGK